MKTFSIAELEQYSLIKAHTFRTWENRFGIFQTKRKSTNIRFYTLEDLAFLLDFSLLNRFGSKISKLAYLNGQSVRDKVLDLKKDEAKQQHQINQLIISMFSFNIEDFELILESSIAVWGIDEAIEEIIVPFLERIQMFSYKGRTSGVYHFTVTALHKKLSCAIEHTKPKSPIHKSALLFLSEGEHYDLFLLYLNYKLRKSGLNVLYLGTNVSVNNLQEVIQKKQPHFVVTYISGQKDRGQKDFSHYLENTAVETPYFITGAGESFGAGSFHKNVKYVPYRQLANEVLALM